MDMGDAQRIIIVEPERVPAEPVEDPQSAPITEPAPVEPDLVPAARR
jgi:hypothetical protein